MQRTLALFLAIFLFSPACFLFSYAASQPAAPVSGNTAVNLNNQDIEKLLKNEEVVLKKIITEHIRQERKRHNQEAEQTYQEAVNLYRQQRPDQAKEVFSNVEKVAPYYKSTDTFLKIIDDKSARESKQKPPVAGKTQDPQLAIDLAQRASILYHQAANLGDNRNTVVVKKKLTKMMMSFQQMSQQEYIQQQMQGITREADKYDQEIFRLTQAKDYQAARKKLLEFQEAMIDDLTRVKQNIARVNGRYLDAEKNRFDY